MHAMKKNSFQQIRLTEDEYKGHPFLDVRIYVKGEGGKYYPTRQGLAVPLERIDAFLAGYADTLEAMEDTEFETVKTGLIARLEEAPDNLYDRNGELVRDLSLGVTTFDRTEQLVALIKPVTREEVLARLREEVLGDSGRLVVRALGTTHEGEPMEPGCPDRHCVAEQMPEIFERAR